MRKMVLVLAMTAGLLGLGATAAGAASDYPYWKLDLRRFDTRYDAYDAEARKFAFFYWDGKAFCRYPSGWNGPGAYELGTRFRRGKGWDGGYEWQGPGTPADHEDDAAYAEYKAAYAHDFRHAAECAGPVRHYRRHRMTVLRRKG